MTEGLDCLLEDSGGGGAAAVLSDGGCDRRLGLAGWMFLTFMTAFARNTNRRHSIISNGVRRTDFHIQAEAPHYRTQQGLIGSSWAETTSANIVVKSEHEKEKEAATGEKLVGIAFPRGYRKNRTKRQKVLPSPIGNQRHTYFRIGHLRWVVT